MTTRTRILEVAAELLAKSPNGDISTRAVCEAAQIGAPVLYRQFGDKNGLLSAVVDHGFDTYLATKREHVPGADPVQDLREGWDSHVAFARAHPNLYRLMNSPAMREPPPPPWSRTGSSPAIWSGRRPRGSCGSRPTWPRRWSCRPMSGWP